MHILLLPRINHINVFSLLCVAWLTACGGSGGGNNDGKVTNYQINGNINGLIGSGLVLQNNGKDDLSVTTVESGFNFITKQTAGSTYEVTVLTQPTAPNQFCTVSNGSGKVSNTDVNEISIDCVTTTYTISGHITGLTGSGLILENNNADLSMVSGPNFTFATAIEDGSDYSVTINTQPTNQLCNVFNGSGKVSGFDISNVEITCTTSTNAYKIGGSVTGLTGTGLILLNNNSESLAVSGAGFTFATSIADGASYNVSIQTQPSNQQCTVDNGSGNVSGADVVNVGISCSAQSNIYTVSGTISGLAGTIVLANNGGDFHTTTGGSFIFSTPLANNSNYAVTVNRHPAGQTCSVSNGSGKIVGANVTNVIVNCATGYSVGGTITGLDPTISGGVGLQINGGERIRGTGSSFIFNLLLLEGDTYAVTVFSQPSIPNQICTISNGSGTVVAASVTDISIDCVTIYNTVGGSISGLVGSGLVLQNNGQDDYAVSGASFTFPKQYASGTDYNVTVLSAPADQICTVYKGSGRISGNISSIIVGCVKGYSISGTITGLNTTSTPMVLQNNRTDNLDVNASSFRFNQLLPDQANYSITLLQRPTSPNQECTISNGAGVIAGANVTDIAITCTPLTYTVSGSITNLTGTGLVLQNRNADNLPVDSGRFTFATAQAGGEQYDISVLSQPTGQTCFVDEAAGTINGEDINSVSVYCETGTQVLSVIPQSHSVKVRWNDSINESYNLYYSSQKGFNPDNYANVPDGAMLTNARSPLVVPNLVNAKAYYFVLEIVGGTVGSRTTEVAARPNEWAFSGSVNTILAGDNGTMYMGGEFTKVGTITGSGIPLSALTGKPATGDFPVVSGMGSILTLGGAIFTSAPDGQGGWYVGGKLTHVGDVSRKHLAHINADGSLDMSWNPETSGDVYALAVSGDTVFVGGGFTTVNGQPRGNLAAIDVNGTLLPWNPNANQPVSALVVDGTAVYVGGRFTMLGGVTRNFLAAIGVDGTLLDWNPDADKDVLDLIVDGSTIYAGGSFAMVGGATHNRLVAIGVDGVVNNSWNPDVSGIVYQIAVNGGIVYIGGSIANVNGVTRTCLAAVDANGDVTGWNPLKCGGGQIVRAMAIKNNTVYVGGTLLESNDFPRFSLAAFGLDGTLTNWNPGVNHNVYSLAIAGDTIFVGGRFSATNITDRRGLAAIHADGTLAKWNPVVRDPLNKFATDVISLTKIGNVFYAGGFFNSVGGTERRNLAAINSDGVLMPWKPETNGYIKTLVVVGNTLYAGGTFQSVNGVPRPFLAAINSSDGKLMNWTPNPDQAINALAVDGSTLYVGGGFENIGGKPRRHLAAINVDGVVTSWNPIGDVSIDEFAPNVFALTVAGNTVYAGGYFPSVGGVARKHLVAIGTDGILGNLNPQTSNGWVYAITVYGGNIYFGGDFTGIDNQPHQRIAAYNLDGTLINWNPDPSGTVSAIAISGNKIYTGGVFSRVGTTPRGLFATFGLDGILQ